MGCERIIAPSMTAHFHVPPLSRSETWLLGVRWREAPRLIPGVALAAAVMVASSFLAGLLGAWVLRLQGIPPQGRPSPVSAIMVAIVLGMLIANTAGVAGVFAPGLQFGIRKLLRLGIILVGIKLSFLDVVKLGAWGVPVVLTLIAAAIFLTRALGRRLGVSDRLATLAAASTAICGVTATVAVAPTIDADDREVAYTIANVTLFGIAAMFLYPYLAHALFAGTPGAAGMFLGTSIHETAQVMGAALSYKEVFHDEAAMKVATVTKLTRNLCLVLVVPALAYLHARGQGAGSRSRRVDVGKLVPVFVLGFVAMAVFRSVGDAGARSGLAFGLWDPAAWARVTRLVGESWAPWALGTAMAAVGLTTRLSVFRGLGLKPLYLGALAATLVGVVSLGLAALVGPHL
jgi:uncharacterized integral membrane protein (TIGR00698 family)